MQVSKAIQRYLIRNVLPESVSRQKDSEVDGILFVNESIISVQIIFPIEKSLPK